MTIFDRVRQYTQGLRNTALKSAPVVGNFYKAAQLGSQALNSVRPSVTSYLQRPVSPQVFKPLEKTYSTLSRLPTSQYIQGRGQELANRVVASSQSLQRPGVLNKGLGALQLAGGVLGATPGGMTREAIVGLPIAGLKTVSQQLSGNKATFGNNLLKGTTGYETIGSSVNPLTRKVFGQQGGDIASQAIDLGNMALGLRGGKLDVEQNFYNKVNDLSRNFDIKRINLKTPNISKESKFAPPSGPIYKLKRELNKNDLGLIRRAFIEASRNGKLNPADIQDIKTLGKKYFNLDMSRVRPESIVTDLYKHAYAPRSQQFLSTIDKPKMELETPLLSEARKYGSAGWKQYNDTLESIQPYGKTDYGWNESKSKFILDKIVAGEKKVGTSEELWLKDQFITNAKKLGLSIDEKTGIVAKTPKEISNYKKAKEGSNEQLDLLKFTSLYNQTKGVTPTNQVSVKPQLGKGILPEQVTTPVRSPLQPGLKTQIENQQQVIPSPTVYNAEATPKTIAKQAVKEKKLAERQANLDYKEWQKQVIKKEGGSRTVSGAINQAESSIKKSTTSPASNPSGLKDLSGFKAWTRDIYRNFKEVYGKEYESVKRLVLDPFDKSKGQMADDLKTWTSDLKKNVVDKFNIQKGSKESSYVQLFGEGKASKQDLISKFGEARANQIVESDKWFRSAYDNLLSQVNEVRARIYPGQADKIIPRRSDYYRHFTEISDGVRGLLNIFDNPSNISSSLAGTSEFVKPKSKWLSFAQKRLGERTQEDAVGGFLDYLKAQTYAKNIDPHISNFRNLADELAQNTAEGTVNNGKMNGFIEYLQDFSNDLSGKTNPADRFIQKIIPGGRKTMGVLNWVNSRVKANTIVGNVSSTIAQIFNVPQGIANAGAKNATTGLGRTISDLFGEGVVSQSNFINERYSDKLIRQFDSRLIDQPKKLAVWLTGVLDNVGTRYIWNMHYDKALSEGIKNPIKYADDITRKLVAGRGVGETPLIQKSKLFQLVAPFTLEVGNLWHVMGDWVGAKQFGKLATFFVVSHIFNKGAEAIRGSDVNIDPIQASMDAYQAFQEEDDKKIGALRAGGRLAGEVISNIPLAGKVAEVYPEYGMKFGGQNVTRKELFGEGDPTRFGSGLLAQQAITDPVFKLLPSFGGQQIKRSIEGIKSFNQGESLTPKGGSRFEIPQTVGNRLKTAVFGQYSIPEAKTYFKNVGKSQSEIIMNEFKNKSQEEKTTLWNNLVKEGKINKDNIGDIKKYLKDKTLKTNRKEKSLRSLPIKDNSRPRAILKELKKLKTKEEKTALWNDYVEKGIITKETAKQIKLLMKEQ